MLPAQDQASRCLGLVWNHAIGDSEVDGGDQVAEDAAQVAGPGGQARWNAGARGVIRRGDVGKTPGGPEMVHEGRAAPTV